jgi:TrmH family RNA methyltransferase
MEKMPSLTGRSHPKIKQVRALQRHAEREATGLFVVEGIHPVGEAVAAGAAIEYICYAPDLLASPFAHDLVEQQSARGLRCYATASDVFASMTDKENPQGLLAVVRQRTWTLEQLTPENFSWGAALVSPQDPGNIGTILRTVDAVGASGLLLLDGGADPYQPGAVRASMGALFWHPIVTATFADFAAWARQGGYHLYGTSAHGITDYDAVAAYTRPAILLLGSEQKGLSSEQMAACEKIIRLPMRGRASSLNLAVAAGVLLYRMLAVET